MSFPEVKQSKQLVQNKYYKKFIECALCNSMDNGIQLTVCLQSYLVAFHCFLHEVPQQICCRPLGNNKYLLGGLGSIRQGIHVQFA